MKPISYLIFLFFLSGLAEFNSLNAQEQDLSESPLDNQVTEPVEDSVQAESDSEPSIEPPQNFEKEKERPVKKKRKRKKKFKKETDALDNKSYIQVSPSITYRIENHHLANGGQDRSVRLEETKMGAHNDEMIKIKVKNESMWYQIAVNSLGPGFNHTLKVGKNISGTEYGLLASIDYLKKKVEATDTVPARVDYSYGGGKDHVRTKNNYSFGVYTIYHLMGLELGVSLSFINMLLKESTDEGVHVLENLSGPEFSLSLGHTFYSTDSFDFLSEVFYEYSQLSGSIESRSFELSQTTLRTANQSFEDDKMSATNIRFKLLGIRIKF